MFARLALLFVVVPLLELALLVQVGRWVGLWPTLLLVFATGVTGAALARIQGLKTLASFRAELAAGRLPSGPLMDGLAVLVGAAFLLTPGLLTDVAGFALLIPVTRRGIRSMVTARIRSMQGEGAVRFEFISPRGNAEGFGPGFSSAGFGDPPSEGREWTDSAAAAAGLDPQHEIDPSRS